MHNLKRAQRKLDALKTKYGKRQYVSTVALSRALNEQFKPMHMVIKFVVDPTHKKRYEWKIEGFYDQRIPGVEPLYPLYEFRVIRRHANPKFMVNKWFWNELFLAIAHEIKHADQYRKRNFRQKFVFERRDLNPKADKYHCNFDEIDAHAYECALEWKIRGGNLLDLPTAKRYYKKTRRWAMPEWRRFVKKVYKYFYQQQGEIWQANKASSTRRRSTKSSRMQD